MRLSLFLITGGHTMKRRAAMLSMLSVMLFAASVTAQTRPDFSGRWTSEPETKTPPASGGGQAATQVSDMGSGWGTNINITQATNQLTVEYAFFVRGDM